MSKILKFLVGLVLLATAIHGSLEGLERRIVHMRRTNQLINGKFHVHDYLGEGSSGILFQGERDSDHLQVAMKFVETDNSNQSPQLKRELEIYSYLNAINNPNVERFGFPALYSYQKWGENLMIATTLFDGKDLGRFAMKDYFDESVGDQCVNSLIVFKEFVRQSKYMHSKGIRHDDIKPSNIVIHGARSYLIDFGLSKKLNEHGEGGTFHFISRRGIENKTRNALDDWESFLYSMCYLNDVKLDWFNDARFSPLDSDIQCQLSSEMKAKTDVTIARIENEIKSAPLKRVYLKFAKEAFKTGSSFPDYDGMYDAIATEINNFAKPWFTWLKLDQISKAKQELMQNPLPDIKKDIPNPSKIKKFTYGKVEYNFFG